MKNKKSLLEIYPDVAAQWHPTKNGDLTPDQVVAGSSKRYWWKCIKGPDHEWDAILVSRTTGGKGCPYCAGKKVSITNSLVTVFPDIAIEWHPTKNGNLTPDQIVVGSDKNIWWKCPKGPDHEWQCNIYHRTGLTKSGCPYCAGKKVSITNSLTTVFPDIAIEWHPTKNGNLTPDQIVVGSNKRYWWKCIKGPDHEWKTTVASRTGKSKRSCPCCAFQKVSVTNSLAMLFPKIAAEWHPTKNGDLAPEQVISGSNKRYWWKCNKGPDHEWKTAVGNRTLHKSNCPCCAGKKVSVTNSLQALLPEISTEWHPTKNGDLIPEQVVTRSGKKVWWKCNKGPDHEWKAVVASRTGGIKSGCPFCDIKPRSKQEIYLAFELLKFIDFDINEQKIKNIKINRQYPSVDIILRKYNIIIEFDGSYWHKDKDDDDLAKTRELINAGWDVIRVREKPLKKITPNDIVFRANDIKQAADKVLSKLEASFNLELPHLQRYMNRKTLINKKAADAYIDKLLSEKLSE